MKKESSLKIPKLKERRKIWESSNGKWRIVKWPHPFTVCIEKFSWAKTYLPPRWEYRDMDDADIPGYVLKKLNSLLSKKRYFYDIFRLGLAT